MIKRRYMAVLWESAGCLLGGLHSRQLREIEEDERVAVELMPGKELWVVNAVVVAAGVAGRLRGRKREDRGDLPGTE